MRAREFFRGPSVSARRTAEKQCARKYVLNESNGAVTRWTPQACELRIAIQLHG